MAISRKTIGRSVVESMVFLAMLSIGASFILLFVDKNGDTGLPIYAGLPFVVALASAATALLFPQPTFWKAFAKMFGGGLLTVAIFSALALILGPPVVLLTFDFIWDFGVGLFNWTSLDRIIAGIFGMMLYFMVVFTIVAVILMFIFSMVSVMVNLVINAIASRNEPDVPQLQNEELPGIQAAERDPFQDSQT